jgi:hypothetical protein
MSADETVERLSARLAGLSAKARDRGGLVARAAPVLADDADFVRKLKPSLIKARAKGDNPGDPSAGPSAGVPGPAGRTVDSAPPNSKRPSGKGGNPLLLLAAAVAAGILLARVLDWSGHAHPRG